MGAGAVAGSGVQAGRYLSGDGRVGREGAAQQSEQTARCSNCAAHNQRVHDMAADLAGKLPPARRLMQRQCSDSGATVATG